MSTGKVLSKLTILCWAALPAILSNTRPMGPGLDTPGTMTTLGSRFQSGSQANGPHCHPPLFFTAFYTLKKIICNHFRKMSSFPDNNSLYYLRKSFHTTLKRLNPKTRGAKAHRRRRAGRLSESAPASTVCAPWASESVLHERQGSDQVLVALAPEGLNHILYSVHVATLSLFPLFFSMLTETI